MAFTISRSQSALTDREKENLDNLVDKECATTEGMISSQLKLKSSLSSKASSHQSMDKHAILRRIRQRRFNNRAKIALEALIGTSEANNNTTTGQEHKWLQLGDSFSSP